MKEHSTLIQIFFCWLLWFAAVYVLSRSSKIPYKINKQARVFGILLILLFCLFNFIDGDYFHYKVMYNDAKVGLQYHLEAVYFWIIDNLSPTYTIFRLIVWGGALSLLLLTYKRISEKPDLTLYYFVLCFIPWFAYARVSLAISMILFGASLVVKPLKVGKKLSFILGLGIMGCAWFFHSSAIVGVVAAIASLFLMKGRRSTIIVLILATPVLLILLSYAVDAFMLMDLSSEDMITGQKRDNYLQGGRNGSMLGGGIGFILQNLISLGGLYLTAIYFISLSLKGKFLQIPIHIRLFACYVFCIVMIAFGLASFGNVSAYVLHYRILFFAMPANAIFLCSMRFVKENHSFYRMILALSCSGAIYTMLYSTYRVMLRTI